MYIIYTHHVSGFNTVYPSNYTFQFESADYELRLLNLYLYK